MGSKDVIDVGYWLPVSRVHVTGSVVTSRSATHATMHTPTAAVVTVLTRADHRMPQCRLRVPARTWTKRHARIDWVSDGRLSGSEASNEDHRWDAATAALSLVATGVGAGAAIGGPFGAVVGGVVAGVGEAGSVLSTKRVVAGGPTQGSTDLPFGELGVDAAYVTHDLANATILARLRRAEGSARVAFSHAADDGTSADGTDGLEGLRHRLRDIRAELARAEAAYQSWLDTQVHVSTETYDLEIDIENLPTAAGARAWLTDTTGDAEVAALRAACVALDIVISCDDAAPIPATAEPAGRVDEVRYRPLRPVLLQTWRRSGPAGQPLSVQRILIARPGHDENLPLFSGTRNASTSVAFDADGALVSLSSDRTGRGVAGAAALGALPGVLKGSLDTGAGMAAPFTAAGRAKALTDELAEATARAALAPAADPNRKLTDEVTRAELQARLRAAQVATASPVPPVSVVVVDAGTA